MHEAPRRSPPTARAAARTGIGGGFRLYARFSNIPADALTRALNRAPRRGARSLCKVRASPVEGRHTRHDPSARMPHHIKKPQPALRKPATARDAAVRYLGRFRPAAFFTAGKSFAVCARAAVH